LVTIALSPRQVLEWLSEVADPEIPVLTIADLGIIRGVRVEDEVIVELAPTYSGCPATEVIEKSVVDALDRQGIENVRIERVLSPPWTTDWISDQGRAKLRAYGIAPPAEGGSKRELLQGAQPVACPRCESTDTSIVSEFGSTACKASYKCNSCLEPFEYFKCL
jgi:ring-1,2-phenylacetyl-CoA epoxidase subunit PaaD